ncbi:MAG: hypothetical protein ACLP5H_31165 [Desulfomonilaceae bacterium]
MLRTGLLTIAMIVALQGFCFGQGFLDSLLGPGGLGLWGGDPAGQQYNNPQMWGGAQGPPQQPYQQPGAPGQQQMTYPPAGAQGYPQQGYGQPQQGVYSDWQNYPPAPVGGDQQQYAPPQEPSAPQQYAAPQQYPTQQQYQTPQQYQAPQRYTAPPVQAAPAQPTQGAPGQPSLRAGQYVPGQAPVAADDLPPGAVRMTTTTPEGTRVEYYPPADEPSPAQGAAQPPVRRLKAKPAAAKAQSAKQVRPREQTAGGTESPGGSSIAMPKPVEIPQGQDPRYGWGAAVNRGPVAPAAR